MATDRADPHGDEVVAEAGDSPAEVVHPEVAVREISKSLCFLVWIFKVSYLYKNLEG